jgi:hypothetical protein
VERELDFTVFAVHPVTFGAMAGFDDGVFAFPFDDVGRAVGVAARRVALGMDSLQEAAR